MFECHFEGIIPELVKAIFSDVLIADVNFRVETGKIDVDPVRILRPGFEKGAVLRDGGIHGVFEGVGIARLIECTVLVRGKIDPEISSSFGAVIAVTGREKGGYHATNSQGGQNLYCIQFKDSFLR